VLHLLLLLMLLGPYPCCSPVESYALPALLHLSLAWTRASPEGPLNFQWLQPLGCLLQALAAHQLLHLLQHLLMHHLLLLLLLLLLHLLLLLLLWLLLLQLLLLLLRGLGLPGRRQSYSCMEVHAGTRPCANRGMG
jgi:hypothetical protein